MATIVKVHGSVQALSAAIGHLRRPLVRIFLRNSVSHATCAELVKRVYVEVANTEFRIAGKKQSVSRITTLSGLTRKEVHRLLTLPADLKSSADKEYRSLRFNLLVS